ncbi:MAG TPA: peptidoglycan editing factor PgeF [Burkholderiaceae bacterium]|nr:peptidoglycan editing factor PgeF [Burkholderiaceae bacterium]
MNPRFASDWLVPDWDAPGVGAVMTTRAGGVSTAPFDSMNLRDGLGDDASAVAENQHRLRQAVGGVPVWLKQVHGATVVRLDSASARADAGVHSADASFTTEPGVVCAVQVADCLPVLFAAPGARGVAAAHAGWRGLAGGVLEASLVALCEAARCEPGELQAWLGACIGPRSFEVGADVLEAFGADPRGEAPAFVPFKPGKWHADLPLLARGRLQAAGVRTIGGGSWCTVQSASRFFSFRRDGVTGRMAAAVWIERA